MTPANASPSLNSATKSRIASQYRRRMKSRNGCATALEVADIPDEIPYRNEIFPNKDEWVNQGDAVVYAPFGGVVAGPMRRQKGFLFAEIDVAVAKASRRKFDASGHYARPDVFSLQVNRQPQVPARFT